MSYPIKDLDGIDEEAMALLRSAGLRTTVKFLEAAKDPKGRKALAKRTGLDEKLLLQWANAADRMRIKGLGRDYATLLRAVGVDTVRELKHRNAERLVKAIRDANAERRLVKAPPSRAAVDRWIEQAKKLTLKITY
jgi:predicted flap endonuclease-1-like 5' DNA nuclease